MTSRLRALLRRACASLGVEVRRIQQAPASVPDRHFYAPLFNPWLGYGDFEHFRRLSEPFSLVSPERLYVLYALGLNALHLPGEFWECGVYKGGTARMLAESIKLSRPDRKLRLFDTFEGMPETDRQLDVHKRGDFADTSLEAVRLLIGKDPHVIFHPGRIPETFAGREKCAIAFAHVDLDIYQSVRDCCQFIYPRLSTGGIMVFDDYGFPSCPGARRSVDEFFTCTPETPVVLPTGQAFVIKLPSPA